jgi:hypothetical protein
MGNECVIKVKHFVRVKVIFRKRKINHPDSVKIHTKSRCEHGAHRLLGFRSAMRWRRPFFGAEDSAERARQQQGRGQLRASNDGDYYRLMAAAGMRNCR